MNIWDQLDAKIGRVEQVLITVLLTVMILLAFFQIVLRNFFSTGLAWSDALVRYLVVWVGFIGAAIAAGENRHLTIDVFTRWVSGAKSALLKAVSHLASAVICGLLTFAAVSFVGFEAQMGSTVFLKLPVWIPELIIPTTFALMCLRYALRFAKQIRTIQKEAFKPEPERIK